MFLKLRSALPFFSSLVQVVMLLVEECLWHQNQMEISDPPPSLAEATALRADVESGEITSSQEGKKERKKERKVNVKGCNMLVPCNLIN